MATLDDSTQAPGRTVDWGKALLAGLIATVVITVTMALFGQNIMKMMGGMIAPGAGTGTHYLLGGAMHLAIGLFYGLLYAWLLGPVRSHGRVVKGLLYAAALTGIALAAMPAMGAMLGGGGSGGPRNPYGVGAPAGGPCTPCEPGQGSGGATNPCNPCGPSGAATNPCNPCGPQAATGTPTTPCNPCGAGQAAKAGTPSNPCGGGGPCNPCGGEGGPWAGLMSLLNHGFYALALAWVYGR